MINRRALAVIGIAATLDTLGAIGFAAAEHVSVGTGLYWSITTATTVGYGDVTPRSLLGHLITVAVMLTVIPLFAATFSLITTGLTAAHISREAERTRQHAEKGHHLMRHLIHHHPEIPDLPVREAA